jgi:hypothetical protein
MHPLTIARTYLLAETSKIFTSDSIQPELAAGIENLSKKQVWRLLEALSVTYRLNPMFRYLSDTGYSWREESVDISTLTLTNMNPAIDAVTYSPAIDHDPLKLRDYLLEYFKVHPQTDPLGLEQFRPAGKKIQYPAIYLEEIDGKLKMLDGSNRVMATLLQGNTTIHAFIAKRTKAGKPWIGDNTFFVLQKLYERSNDADKVLIISMVKLLMRESADGRDAVKNYWVDHVKDEEGKKIGRALLEEMA